MLLAIGGFSFTADQGGELQIIPWSAQFTFGAINPPEMTRI